MASSSTAAADVIHRFYTLREQNNPELLRPLLTDDVQWHEPEIGDHMGTLTGADAVLDMITRAQQVSHGSFTLQITDLLHTTNACAAVIAWHTASNRGRELATFQVAHGKITTATFLPEDPTADEDFWRS